MSELRQGTIIQERYKLLKHIGSGSFGDVWLAQDTIIDEEVAIKFYVALDDKGQEEFIREYKTSLKLNHTNLLTARHYAIWERRPYLILEYCPNGSSEKFIGEADEKTIWRFIRDVAAGLAYLHKNSIIHQDTKPDNVLINSQGDFVITDFGISYKIRTTMRKQSGRLGNSGTVAYMGPERFKSAPELITASDTWSLGASIYELATGDLPFNGLGGGMMLSGAELPNLPQKFSRELNEIMRQCLSKEPWDRPLPETLEEIAIKKLNGETIDSYIPKQKTQTYNNNSQRTETYNHKNNQKTEIYNTNNQEKETKRIEKVQENPQPKKNNKLILSIVLGIIAIVAGIIIFNRVPNNVGGDTTSTTTATTEETDEVGNQIFTVNGVEFKMIKVEGGTFTMGATSEQGSEADDDEKPTHQVTLSSYYIGETEVTQALWKAVMGKNPSYYKGDNLPVEQVSYNDIQKFIKKLNQKTGKTFRLPTEAEWEYAARGGNKSKGYKYSGSNNIEDVAWYDGNSNYKTHTVKTKQANELGLYDMTGNVWEWCSDRYGDYSSSSQTNPKGPNSGSNRVLRGGGWNDLAWGCRVSYRGGNNPSISYYNYGFRLALAR